MRARTASFPAYPAGCQRTVDSLFCRRANLPATARIDHAGQDHRNDRRDAAEQRRGAACHRRRAVDRTISTQYARAHDDAGFDLALVGYTASSAEGFLVALHAASAHQAARLSGGASAGIRCADPDGPQDRDVRSSDQRPARRPHHHRQDRRRAAGRWRLQPEGRALQARRGISRIDEAHLGERTAVRFRRRILPRQGRLLRCAPAAAAASAVVLRRRLRWRARRWAPNSATSTPSTPSR